VSNPNLSTIAPQGLEAELKDLDAQIARVADEHEAVRLEAARAALERPSDDRDARIPELHRRMGARAKEGKMLRRRRREVREILNPSSPAKALINVPIPPSVVRVKAKLAAARDERAELIATARAKEGGDVAARKLRKALDEIEAQIVKLRAEEARAREPYHAALRKALQPIVRDAAEGLLTAAQQVQAAMATLMEAAQHMPSDPGRGNALAEVGFINILPTRAMKELALRLLNRKPAAVAD
jgi:hypothetical protein